MRDGRSVRRVLVTCPHVALKGCDESNDPGAFEAATALYRALAQAGVPCSFLGGSGDRSTCDLNRAACEAPAFHGMLRDRIVTHDVVLDVHSFPAGEAFGGITDVVCLLPDKGEYHAWLLDVVRRALPGLTVLQGGDNRVINDAAARGKAALLFEVPYRRCGTCCFTGDWGILARHLRL